MNLASHISHYPDIPRFDDHTEKNGRHMPDIPTGHIHPVTPSTSGAVPHTNPTAPPTTSDTFPQSSITAPSSTSDTFPHSDTTAPIQGAYSQKVNNLAGQSNRIENIGSSQVTQRRIPEQIKASPAVDVRSKSVSETDKPAVGASSIIGGGKIYSGTERIPEPNESPVVGSHLESVSETDKPAGKKSSETKKESPEMDKTVSGTDKPAGDAEQDAQKQLQEPDTDDKINQKNLHVRIIFRHSVTRTTPLECTKNFSPYATIQDLLDSLSDHQVYIFNYGDSQQNLQSNQLLGSLPVNEQGFLLLNAEEY